MRDVIVNLFVLTGGIALDFIDLLNFMLP